LEVRTIIHRGPPENVASGGAIKSETKYCKYKYPDDREDVLTRSLFNN